MGEKEVDFDGSIEDDEENGKRGSASTSSSNNNFHSSLKSKKILAKLQQHRLAFQEGPEPMSKRELAKINKQIELSNQVPEKVRKKTSKQHFGKKSPHSDSSVEKETHKLQKRHSGRETTNSQSTPGNELASKQPVDDLSNSYAPGLGSSDPRHDGGFASALNGTKTINTSFNSLVAAASAPTQTSTSKHISIPTNAFNSQVLSPRGSNSNTTGIPSGLIVMEDDSEVSASCEQLEESSKPAVPAPNPNGSLNLTDSNLSSQIVDGAISANTSTGGTSSTSYGTNTTTATTKSIFVDSTSTEKLNASNNTSSFVSLMSSNGTVGKQKKKQSRKLNKEVTFSEGMLLTSNAAGGAGVPSIATTGTASIVAAFESSSSVAAAASAAAATTAATTSIGSQNLIEVISTTNEGSKLSMKLAHHHRLNQAAQQNQSNGSSTLPSALSAATSAIQPSNPAATFSYIPRKGSTFTTATLPTASTSLPAHNNPMPSASSVPPAVSHVSANPENKVQFQTPAVLLSQPAIDGSNGSQQSQSQIRNGSNIIQLHRNSIDDGGAVSVRQIPKYPSTGDSNPNSISSFDAQSTTATSVGSIQIKTPSLLHAQPSSTVAFSASLSTNNHSTAAVAVTIPNGSISPFTNGTPLQQSSSMTPATAATTFNTSQESTSLISIPIIPSNSSPYGGDALANAADSSQQAGNDMNRQKKKKKAKLQSKDEAKLLAQQLASSSSTTRSEQAIAIPVPTSNLSPDRNGISPVDESQFLKQQGVMIEEQDQGCSQSNGISGGPILPASTSAGIGSSATISIEQSQFPRNSTEYQQRLKRGPLNKRLYENQSKMFQRLYDYQESVRRDREVQLEKYVDDIIASTAAADASDLSPASSSSGPPCRGLMILPQPLPKQQQSLQAGEKLFSSLNPVSSSSLISPQTPSLAFKASAFKDERVRQQQQQQQQLVRKNKVESHPGQSAEYEEVESESGEAAARPAQKSSRIKPIDASAVLLEKSYILQEKILKKFKDSTQTDGFKDVFSPLHSDFALTYLTPSYCTSVLSYFNLNQAINTKSTLADHIEIEY